MKLEYRDGSDRTRKHTQADEKKYRKDSGRDAPKHKSKPDPKSCAPKRI